MKNKWIHFSIDRESLIGMLSGVGIVILSVIMTIFNNDIANIILRDILMILVLGFFFPLYFRSVYKELHADHETGAADNK